MYGKPIAAGGYGDITPQTGLGKLIASFMMLLGLGHPGRAHRHRHRRDGRAALQPARRGAPVVEARLRRLPHQGPRAKRKVLQGLWGRTAARAGKPGRQGGY
ncbi:ion channel [Massilia sp. TWR1-2-2]|uniref:ion channel n=1 Tax=Massilia sp. TWR1-2-2 TaxID=2804584 RepID=UPI003CF74CF7